MNLDMVFGSLADPTRRDILRRVARHELSVREIAQPYDFSLAAISKHLKILEKAGLIVKRRHGKQRFVGLSPAAFRDVENYLRQYVAVMNAQVEPLEVAQYDHTGGGWLTPFAKHVAGER